MDRNASQHELFVPLQDEFDWESSQPSASTSTEEASHAGNASQHALFVPFQDEFDWENSPPSTSTSTEAVPHTDHSSGTENEKTTHPEPPQGQTDVALPSRAIDIEDIVDVTPPTPTDEDDCMEFLVARMEAYQRKLRLCEQPHLLFLLHEERIRNLEERLQKYESAQEHQQPEPDEMDEMEQEDEESDGDDQDEESDGDDDQDEESDGDDDQDEESDGDDNQGEANGPVGNAPDDHVFKVPLPWRKADSSDEESDEDDNQGEENCPVGNAPDDHVFKVPRPRRKAASLAVMENRMIFRKTWRKPSPLKGVPRESLPEYEVDGIIASKWKGGKLFYKVKWTGWSVEESTWEPVSHLLPHCKDMIRAFHDDEKLPNPPNPYIKWYGVANTSQEESDMDDQDDQDDQESNPSPNAATSSNWRPGTPMPEA